MAEKPQEPHKNFSPDHLQCSPSKHRNSSATCNPCGFPFLLFLFSLSNYVSISTCSAYFYCMISNQTDRGEIRIVGVYRFLVEGWGLFPLLSSVSWATLIIHGPHVLQTDYKHLHLTTIIIIITAKEFYSPSCNLRLMGLRFDFGVWFKGGFVYSSVRWDKL